MILLLLVGCLRFHAPVDVDSAGVDDTGGDTAPPTPTAPHVVWGDLHNHTNLSHDGCEAPERDCLPDGDLPADGVLDHARERGLGYTAITDHAEFTVYSRLLIDGDTGGSTELHLDIWDRTRELVEAGDGTGVFGVMGYEWTSSCSAAGGALPEGYTQTHRTVLIEDTAACAAWRIPSCRQGGELRFGDERYTYSSLDPAVQPSDLLARLIEVPTLEGCEASRWTGFFHHVAQTTPASVDWALPESWVEGDTVVEIASEHGSSECEDPAATEGCDWRVSPTHTGVGSIQYMLQQGHQLGFVGGTDNHMDDPGRISGGPGRVRNIQDPDPDPAWHVQYTNGTLTGALTDAIEFDRAELFDVLAARHTVAASWPAGGLVILATGADGERYLPGDDVPASAMPLALTVALDDTMTTDWVAEVVDPYGAVSDTSPLTIPPGEARYVRIRACQGTTLDDCEASAEHRVFASPFFAE